MIDESSPLRGLFPLDKEYAVTLPALAIAGAVTLGGLYIAFTFLAAAGSGKAVQATAKAAKGSAKKK